jgi:hypothetical protein
MLGMGSALSGVALGLALALLLGKGKAQNPLLRRQ